ncbi:adenosylcobalamin-dependent ribonucleoside-diphosphate reductase [Mesoaciditoga lauensis]|uniref:adenosylcobalamin-dependent ribonucleoside-diphosphate reductase n=1 Tax=Mesoaciditoga lauensis TaxID=1495039 RepID=UPI000569AE92|nr:adenosylcobalamin-dependent ribonucleoside-diphosphate reductase [Mesoaciditoga lauensis]
MLSEIMEKFSNIEPSKNAERILKERYFWKNQEGKFLENSWSDVARRVARVIATAELKNPQLEGKKKEEKLSQIKKWEETFYNILNARIFIPNSPTLFNAGSGVDMALLQKDIEKMELKDYEKIFSSRNHLHMLSACFVVPVEDSIDGIFDAVKDYALITKAGGGVGSNFSRLRPKGSFVAGTSGRSSGPVSFMHVFNSAIGVVEQGYKRRGALMGILNIDHPDIKEFIDAKKDNTGESVLKFFNISVGIPNKEEILRAYETDGEIELHHPKSKENGKIKVREILEEIAKNAWKTGDPGLAILDEMNKYNALYPFRKIESTNPCGEIGLPPFEACNLGSIDVAKFYQDGAFDHEAFKEACSIAIRFLDDVIDVNVFPLKEIDDAVRSSRRLGLGIMGFANLLYKLNIPYNSESGRKFASNLTAELALQSHKASYELALEKGNFPFFEKSRYLNEEGFIPFAMGSSDLDNEIRKAFKTLSKAHRNVAVLTVAPTGSISNIADTSSGLEPNFLLAYTRYMTKSDGSKEALMYVNDVLVERLGDSLTQEKRELIIKEGSLKHIDGIPEDVKKVFVVSHDISPDDHLKMQEAFQNYVDNNISKTINLPNSATVEDVLDIYLKALKSSVRGVTIYRDGSLQTQVLNSNKKIKTKDAPRVKFFILDENHKLRARPRKETLRSVTRKYKHESGTTYITVSFDSSGEAIEVFVSNGGETAEIIGRLTSVALRSGVSIEEILEQLQKVKGGYSKGVAAEIKKAIDDFSQLWGEAYEEYQEEEEVIHIDGSRKTPEEVEKFVVANGLKWYNDYYIDDEGNTYCPVCLSKNSLVSQEGCVTCMNCNWSKCTVG